MATALITGSARRIGKEIALNLSKDGFNIALHYHKSLEEAKKTQIEIEKNKVQCRLFQCDLTYEKDVINLIPSVIKTFPDLCVLVNSASIFEKSSLLETEIELFNNIFNINFKAPFILTKDFGRFCKKGNIINIIDTKISKNNFLYAPYSLSKKNLAELTLISAKELSPNIRVNGISPGLILPPDGETEEYLDELSKNIPLKRKGNTDDIVNAIDFIIKNEYITGQIIYVDGGQHL